jgi:hypothetical protein
MTENVNASIISQVEVKKEGDGFIVNTELKDDAELKNNRISVTNWIAIVIKRFTDFRFN